MSKYAVVLPSSPKAGAPAPPAAGDTIATNKPGYTASEPLASPLLTSAQVGGAVACSNAVSNLTGMSFSSAAGPATTATTTAATATSTATATTTAASSSTATASSSTAGLATCHSKTANGRKPWRRRHKHRKNLKRKAMRAQNGVQAPAQQNKIAPNNLKEDASESGSESDEGSSESDETGSGDSVMKFTSGDIQAAMLGNISSVAERLQCSFCDTFSLEGLDHANEDRLWASVSAVRNGPSSPGASTSRRFNSKNDSHKRQRVCNASDSRMDKLEGEVVENEVSLMAVFDGHGGQGASSWLARQFAPIFAQTFRHEKRARLERQRQTQPAVTPLASHPVTPPAKGSAMATNKISTPGWRRSTHGHYYNTITGETTWELPTSPDRRAAETAANLRTRPLVSTVLTNSVATAEDVFMSRAARSGDDSGACLLACTIHTGIPGGNVTAACVGDCRAIVCRNLFLDLDTCGTAETVQITKDQTSGEYGEKRRIEAAGGYVQCGRLAGVLEPSRSIGDSDLKGQGSGLIAVPVVTEFNPWKSWGKDKDDWQSLTLIMATDGMWDTIQTKECASLLRTFLMHGEAVSVDGANGQSRGKKGKSGKKGRAQARSLHLKALRNKKNKTGGRSLDGSSGRIRSENLDKIEFARLLANEAKRRGSRDDITVIVAHYTREQVEGSTS